MPSSPMDATATKNQKPIKTKETRPQERRQDKKTPPSSSWGAMGFFSSCKHNQSVADRSSNNKKKNGRNMGCAGSICGTKESSVHSNGTCNTPDGMSKNSKKKSSVCSNGASCNTSSRALKAPTDRDKSSAPVSASSSFNSATSVATSTVTSSSSSSSALSSPPSSLGGSFRAMQLRKRSGSYECQPSVVDPRGSISMPWFPCPDCGEVFMKDQSLELHTATRHAELGPEDTSRNVIEIIFQSSWLKKQVPVCKIDRILRVHNTDRTLKRFEEYREGIRERASREARKNPRCIADGNELLRFHCTTFTCSLGADGATSMCQPPLRSCSLCSIIKDGFRVDGDGKVAMMATSGRAHDMAQAPPGERGERRAMLVCRVVAGRVKKSHDHETIPPEECDSVAAPSSSEGIYSDFDELLVFNPRAILPCFVVIYSGY